MIHSVTFKYGLHVCDCTCVANISVVLFCSLILQIISRQKENENVVGFVSLNNCFSVMM